MRSEGGLPSQSEHPSQYELYLRTVTNDSVAVITAESAVINRLHALCDRTRDGKKFSPLREEKQIRVDAFAEEPGNAMLAVM